MFGKLMEDLGNGPLIWRESGGCFCGVGDPNCGDWLCRGGWKLPASVFACLFVTAAVLLSGFVLKGAWVLWPPAVSLAVVSGGAAYAAAVYCAPYRWEEFRSGIGAVAPPVGWLRAATFSLAGLMCCLMIRVGWDVVVRGPGQGGYDLTPFAAPGWRLALVVAASGLLTPVVEEVFFRGYLLRAWRVRLGWTAGIGVSAGVFAVIHLQPEALAPLFVVGLVLGALVRATGSIFCPMSVHLCFNLLTLAANFAAANLEPWVYI